MVVQVITAQVRPDQVDELARLLGDTGSISAAAPDRLPDMRSGWLLLDRNTCKCLALTVWTSEAELRAGQRQGLPAPAEQVLATFAATPTREVFEVIASV